MNSRQICKRAISTAELRMQMKRFVNLKSVFRIGSILFARLLFFYLPRFLPFFFVTTNWNPTFFETYLKQKEIIQISSQLKVPIQTDIFFSINFLLSKKTKKLKK